MWSVCVLSARRPEVPGLFKVNVPTSFVLRWGTEFSSAILSSLGSTGSSGDQRDRGASPQGNAFAQYHMWFSRQFNSYLPLRQSRLKTLTQLLSVGVSNSLMSLWSRTLSVKGVSGHPLPGGWWANDHRVCDTLSTLPRTQLHVPEGDPCSSPTTNRGTTSEWDSTLPPGNACQWRDRPDYLGRENFLFTGEKRQKQPMKTILCTHVFVERFANKL